MPLWLAAATVVVAAMALWCGWQLASEMRADYKAGLEEERKRAEMRELLERRRSRRTDGRIDRRETR